MTETILTNLQARREWELKNGVFIKDISELETLSPGKIVHTEYLGSVVFEGREGEFYNLLTDTFGSRNPSKDFLYSFRGERPFLSRNGKGLLDFMKMEPSIYVASTRCVQKYLEKLKFYKTAYGIKWQTKMT